MLRNCRIVGLLVLAIASLCALDRSARADDTANLLQGVRWAGPAITLDGLRGKTVVVIDYATWCPICNKWSPDLCKQIKDYISNEPVVVLAINTDNPTAAKKYITDRDFFAPNILHGFDADIAKRAGMESLWGYMIIDASGKVVKKGHAGSFFGGDNAKRFVLVDDLKDVKNKGEFIVIQPEMADAVKAVLWPFELGLTASIPSDARRRLSADQQKQIDAAMTEYLGKELEKIRTLAKGEIDDRFDAYDRAVTLSMRFKSSAQGKDARKLVLSLEGDAKFKRELAAKRAYDKCQQSAGSAKHKASAMRSLAKRFEGTQYGEKAKTAAEEK